MITKSWYKSKTIIGAIIAAVGGLFNLNIEPTIVNDIGQAVANTDFLSVGSILTLMGSGIAIWGRIYATTMIKTTT